MNRKYSLVASLAMVLLASPVTAQEGPVQPDLPATIDAKPAATLEGDGDFASNSQNSFLGVRKVRKNEPRQSK